MEREFLEKMEANGGKLSKELIDQIMAENDKDVKAEQIKTTAKETELVTANGTIEELQETVKKFDGVDPAKLKQDLAELQTKYDGDLAQAKLENALEVALMQGKSRNTKAVKALLKLDDIKLDGDKLLGLEDQLTKLKTDAAYLFEPEQQTTDPNQPTPPGVTVDTGAEHNGGAGAEPNSLSEALAGYYQATV